MVPVYTDRRNCEGKACSLRLELGVEGEGGQHKRAVMSCFESAPSVCCSCVIPYHFQPACCSDITGIELWRGETVHSGIFASVHPAYLK